jgi:polyhydroxyalkanoate synthesis regulator phasin
MNEENKSLAEQLKKAVDAGVDLAQKTWDEVGARGKEFVKKAKLPEKEAAGLLKGFQKTLGETQKKLETRVGQVVKDVLKKANLVTAEDMKAVKRELQALKKDVKAMKAPKAGKAKAPKAAKTAKADGAPKTSGAAGQTKAAKAKTTPKTVKAPKAPEAPRPKKSS